MGLLLPWHIWRYLTNSEHHLSITTLLIHSYHSGITSSFQPLPVLVTSTSNPHALEQQCRTLTHVCAWPVLVRLPSYLTLRGGISYFNELSTYITRVITPIEVRGTTESDDLRYRNWTRSIRLARIVLVYTLQFLEMIIWSRLALASAVQYWWPDGVDC